MDLIDRVLVFFLVLISSFSSPIHSCHAGANLARNKTYILVPSPNYSQTALGTDTTALTDGIYTKGHFWAKKTTVGWVNAKNVRILIDLESNVVIDGITFSTAQGRLAEVCYPERVDAFVGPDKKHLLYVGDLAKGINHSPRSYEAKRLELKGISAKGRYVLLVVRADGPYIFCDEIEVHGGVIDNGRVGHLDVEQASILPIEKYFLLKMIEELKPTASNKPYISSRLRDIERSIIANDATFPNIESLEADILQLRRELLSGLHDGKELLVCPYNPWAPFTPATVMSPKSIEGITLVTPIGGVDYAALVITNLAPESRLTTLSLPVMLAELTDLTLYEVSFVKSAAMEYVADPLVPLKGAIRLRPGESRMVLVQAAGKKSGTGYSDLAVSLGGNTTEISVRVRITKVALPGTFVGNSITWGDLNSPLVKNRTIAAIQDLSTHHTNVLVINPSDLPLVDPEKTPNFSRLKRQLDHAVGVKKVLLFMNFRSEHRLTSGGTLCFMDRRWQEGFRKWYNGAILTAKAAGFAPEQVYLYPFDEMQDVEIDRFITFAKWVRRELPKCRLYATLGNKNSEKALPYLDIAQVVNENSANSKFLAGKAELWLYDAKGPAKSQSPYSYYRLMAWKAFHLGYKGVGFWAYADIGWEENTGTAWNDFDGRRPDHAVVYEGEGGSIISSRRWEAWKLGIEDFELLTMYEKAKGDKASKGFSDMVLNHPEDTSKADEVKHKILIDLSATID
jgi:hypothetical protein